MSEELTLAIPHEILEQNLRKLLNDRLLKVHGVVVTKPPLKGDHFVSVVEMVEVSLTSRGKQQKVHFFMKKAVDSEFHKQMTAATQLMVKEESFYNILLPDYQAYVKNFLPKMNLDFIPKPIYVKDDIVLLENLVRTYNFKMAPFSLNGMNLHQGKLALTVLAKFHAISYAMKQDVNLKDKYDFLENTMFSTVMDGFMGKMLNSMFASVMTVLEDDQNYREVHQNFSELAEYLFTIGKETTVPEEPLNVICHGDCWNNNMMFHYEHEESDKPDDIRLLDYQVIRYVPITCDLLYFVCSSTNTNFRKNHLHELLKFYYGQFYNALTIFKKQNTCFPFELLEKDFRKRRLLGLVFSVPMLINNIIPKEELPEPEDMTESGHEDMFAKMLGGMKENDRVRELIGDHMTGIYEEVKDDVIAYLEKKRKEKKKKEEVKEDLEEDNEEDREEELEDLVDGVREEEEEEEEESREEKIDKERDQQMKREPHHYNTILQM